MQGCDVDTLSTVPTDDDVMLILMLMVMVIVALFLAVALFAGGSPKTTRRR